MPARDVIETVALLLAAGLGIVFGVVLALVISQWGSGIWRESPAIAVLLVVTGGYFTIDFAGESGYLGALLAGLIVGNMDVLGLGMHSRREWEIRSFAATTADVVVMFVFLVLGANCRSATSPTRRCRRF